LARTFVKSSSPRAPSPFKLLSGAKSPPPEIAGLAGQDGSFGFTDGMHARDERVSSLFQGDGASLNWKESIMPSFCAK
jgi:hypothetical protein